MENVTECKKIRDWVKDGKTIPIYAIGLSDGQGGESVGSEIPIGTPVTELVITPNANPQYASRIKWNKPGSTGGFKGGNRGGNESFALSYAKDIAVAHINHGKDFNAGDVVKVAEVFYTWLQTKK